MLKAKVEWEETEAREYGMANWFDNPINVVSLNMSEVGVTLEDYNNEVPEEDFLDDLTEEQCCEILEKFQEIDGKKLANVPDGPYADYKYEVEKPIYGQVRVSFFDESGNHLKIEDMEGEHQQKNNIVGKFLALKFVDWSIDVTRWEMLLRPSKQLTHGKEPRGGDGDRNYYAFRVCVGQIVEMPHFDCNDCQEYRGEILSNIDDKFSELIA